MNRTIITMNLFIAEKIKIISLKIFWLSLLLYICSKSNKVIF
ncbi:hypothetical protein A1OE_1351 [Candidatus Endolissoclinum faulkneri L2]|uniref:Uncharacterized protein n=1 Tax=Candidatus Endolissoclinum faulkneri L2 TaxID=1193729 RepID=K7YSL6_9PROT|nr:hypothetical protein A1OE_1351 [Candidatus Endolissoclinum faulkneri L2]